MCTYLTYTTSVDLKGTAMNSSVWIRLVAAYREMIAIVCSAIKECEPGDEITISSIRSLANIASTWSNGGGMDLDELSQVYDLKPWESSHLVALATLELVNNTAPTHASSFAAIYQIAAAAISAGDAQLLEAAQNAAVDYLRHTSRDEMNHCNNNQLNEFDRLIEQWSHDSHPELQAVAQSIREVYA